jgi:hypothetical protein
LNWFIDVHRLKRINKVTAYTDEKLVLFCEKELKRMLTYKAKNMIPPVPALIITDIT